MQLLNEKDKIVSFLKQIKRVANKVSVVYIYIQNKKVIMHQFFQQINIFLETEKKSRKK